MSEYRIRGTLGRLVRKAAAVALTMACLAAAGCQGELSGSAQTAGEGKKQSDRGKSKELSARQILDQMVEAYQKCTSYADSAELHFQFVQNGREQTPPPIPLSVTFQRPNKLRLHAFEAVVISDGRDLRAIIEPLEGQVLSVAAPPMLTYDDLFTDKLLSAAIRSGGGFELTQLKLLLHDDPLKSDLTSAEPPRRLEDKKFGEELCHRVQISAPAGERIYWIDAQTHALRKLQLPTEEIKRKTDPEGQISDLEVWLTLTGAQFDKTPAEHAFEFAVPKNAQLLKRFLPPAPVAPSPILRQPPDEFEFDNLASQKINAASLEGKVVVLDFWATWCEWCFRGFPNLETVYEKYKDDDRVAIIAVCTDTADVTDADVEKAFRAPGLKIPIARDREDFAHKTFKIEGLPTMIILGTDGKVQDVEIGYKADLADVLPKKLEKLLAGNDLAGQALAAYERERQKYDQDAADAIIGSTAIVEIPQAQIAERTEPATLELAELWKTVDVKAPGNLLIVERDGAGPSILAIDGSRSVVELDASGSVRTRHELPIPPETGVSYLRTGTDGEGARFYAAFASMQQQVLVFDADWILKAKYPDGEHKHPGIADVQLADLDGDGSLQLAVSFFGTVGIHKVSLDGQRRWSNRSLENVAHMTLIGPDAKGQSQLLCVDGRGLLTPINHAGKPGQTIRIKDRAAYHVRAELAGEPPQSLCALCEAEPGVTVAVGLDLTGAEQWHYDLPKGVHQQPIEALSWGRLTDKRCWILAAADGSIHLLSPDGDLVDHFNYGQTLTGIATANRVSAEDDRALLIVATPAGITAWAVSARQ